MSMRCGCGFRAQRIMMAAGELPPLLIALKFRISCLRYREIRHRRQCRCYFFGLTPVTWPLARLVFVLTVASRGWGHAVSR